MLLSFMLKKKLTGISLITHVKLAAGLENSDEQLTRTTSPGRYLFSNPSIVGFVSGISIYNRTFSKYFSKQLICFTTILKLTLVLFRFKNKCVFNLFAYFQQNNYSYIVERN